MENNQSSSYFPAFHLYEKGDILMKKLVCLLLICILAVASLTACAEEESSKPEKGTQRVATKEKKPSNTPTPTPTEEVTPTPIQKATPTPTQKATPTPTQKVTPTPKQENSCKHSFKDGECQLCGTSWNEFFIDYVYTYGDDLVWYYELDSLDDSILLDSWDLLFYTVDTEADELGIMLLHDISDDMYCDCEIFLSDGFDDDTIGFLIRVGDYEEDYEATVTFWCDRDELSTVLSNTDNLKKALIYYDYFYEDDVFIDSESTQAEFDAVAASGVPFISSEQMIEEYTLKYFKTYLSIIDKDLAHYGTSLEEAGIR